MNSTKRICKHCGQEYEISTGLHNWKRLFNKPSFDDWLTLFMIAMVIIGAFMYYNETKQCKEVINNLDDICTKRNTILYADEQAKAEQKYVIYEQNNSADLQEYK